MVSPELSKLNVLRAAIVLSLGFRPSPTLKASFQLLAPRSRAR